MNRMDIAGTIARLRHERGLTQEQLAAEFDVTKAAVSKWELGQSLPDISLLPRIAAFFGISLDELFSWSAQMDDLEIGRESARISALFASDAETAYRELAVVTAEHASCWKWLLVAASILSARSVVDQDRCEDLRGRALALYERIEDGCREISVLRQARQGRAGLLSMDDGGVNEAVSILEDLVEPMPGTAASLLCSLLEKTGRGADACRLAERELYGAVNTTVHIICSDMGKIDGSGPSARAEALLRAAEGMIDAFAMETAMPLDALQLLADAAAARVRLGRLEEARGTLERFANLAERFCAAGCPTRGFSRNALFPTVLDHTRGNGTLESLLGMRMSKGVAALVKGRPEWDDLAADPSFSALVDRICALDGE